MKTNAKKKKILDCDVITQVLSRKFKFLMY